MELFTYILPLAAGFIVSLATLFIKRSIEEGAGIMRVSFIVNWTFFLCIAPTLFFGDPVLDWSLWYWPILASISAFLGGLFILISIRSGAVSVQTSLMGTKAIFVAVLAVIIFAKPISVNLWVASFLAFVAVLILGGSDLFKKSIDPRSILYALLSSFCFAVTDVLVAKEAANFGMWPFLNLMLGSLAFISLIYIPFFRKGLSALSYKSCLWIFGTAVCMGIQYSLLLYSLATYQNPTAINIMYSSRGLWGVVLVWFVGHWFANTERHAGHKVFIRRLFGALLICVAIVIVLSDT